MRSIKQIESRVDRLIEQLESAKDDYVLRNCCLYRKSGAGFMIAVAENGKKLIVTSDEYDHHHGFQGCILDKYNINVYDLADYMVAMRLLTRQESEAFCRYAAKRTKQAR